MCWGDYYIFVYFYLKIFLCLSKSIYTYLSVSVYHLNWVGGREQKLSLVLHLRDLCDIHLELYNMQLKNLKHRRCVSAERGSVGIIRTWRWFFRLWEEIGEP